MLILIYALGVHNTFSLFEYLKNRLIIILEVAKRCSNAIDFEFFCADISEPAADSTYHKLYSAIFLKVLS